MTKKINFSKMDIHSEKRDSFGNPIAYLKYGKQQCRLAAYYGRYHLMAANIEELLQTPLSLSLYKQMFKQNPRLFNSISGLDGAIEQEVKRCAAPGLHQKIQRKQKLIEKHQSELDEMLSLYELGEESD